MGRINDNMECEEGMGSLLCCLHKDIAPSSSQFYITDGDLV